MATPLIPTIIMVDRKNIIVFRTTSFISSTRLYISRLSQVLRLPIHYKLVFDIPFNGILLLNDKSNNTSVLRRNSSLTQHVQQWEYIILNYAFGPAYVEHGVWINVVLVLCCTSSTAVPKYACRSKLKLPYLIDWDAVLFMCLSQEFSSAHEEHGVWTRP